LWDTRSAVTDGTADRLLLERIARRDATAVAELYDRHCRVLYGIALRILRSASDAEDVLQDVFVRVWTRADSYDERLGAPGAWLTRIARNRAIDKLRARATRGDAHPPSLDELNALERTTVSDQPSPETTAEQSQTRHDIRGALALLPDEQRTLIEAAFFEGYTHSELADRFGLPLGTVKTRIRSGMLAMRQRLEHVV
jgi:RNA polymerase sigma-70 factor, ECF subfamily